MRAFGYSRFALGIGALTGLLCACGGGSPVPVATDSAVRNASGQHHQIFAYSGVEQTFVVPAGVTRLTVTAHGAQGAGFSYGPSNNFPGFPGRVYAVIRVHPGDTLYVFVGGPGSRGGPGGFNGGGAGGSTGFGSYVGNGGGGASDVRLHGDKLKDRIIVAAGGGGSGNCFYYCYSPGGNGGGLDGESGGGASTGSRGVSGAGGSGATQSQGGKGGAGGGNGQSGGNGSLGFGGNGGAGGGPIGSYSGGFPAGGGGGGYYGGAGGGGGGYYDCSCGEIGAGGGGGGGSSYVEPSAIKSLMWTGWRARGDGRVIFSWK